MMPLLTLAVVCGLTYFVIAHAFSQSWRHRQAMSRLWQIHYMNSSSSREPVGIANVIASAIAYMNSGGTLAHAFERDPIQESSTPHLDTELSAAYFRRILSAQATLDEQGISIDATAQELFMACRLSSILGCEASRCLGVVASSYNRSRLLEELKANAFAMPKATVSLLSALPAATVVLGEILGARPVAFLFGSVQGVACLVLGSFAYGIGMAWMRMLLASMSETVHGNYGKRERISAFRLL
jgi:tight adherence protein B